MTSSRNLPFSRRSIWIMIPNDPVPLRPCPWSIELSTMSSRQQTAHPGPGEDPDVITLLKETFAVAKRRILTGAVRVETRTELLHENRRSGPQA